MLTTSDLLDMVRAVVEEWRRGCMSDTKAIAEIDVLLGDAELTEC